MDMGLDKPWEHQLPGHLELFAGYGVEPRGHGTNTPLLNGDVLLLSSDNTAVHNQIVHASSWRFSLAWCSLGSLTREARESNA